MVWSSDETRLFVKLYLGHSCLWNTEDADYKFKAKRLEAHQYISKKFQALTNIQMTDQEVRIKIKNLRSTYCQEIKKLKLREKKVSGKSNKSNLKWFDDLHKCLSSICTSPMFGKRPSVDDQQELETEAEDSSQKIWMPTLPTEDNDNNGIETDEVPFSSDPNGDYILLLKDEPDQDPVEVEQTPYKTRKRKHRRRMSSSDQDVETKLNSGLDDEYDIYGKYIATQLRCMGVKRATQVQLQIQSIVSEARIDALTSQKKN